MTSIAPEGRPLTGLTEDDWRLLLSRIRRGRCTPFLGAGTSHGHIPLGGEIAQGWAARYGYPLPDSTDLPRVSQFLATRHDPMFPKEELAEMIGGCKVPTFSEPDEPHAALADLQLPVYITTNYDNFMLQALWNRGAKRARCESCRWNSLTRHEPSVFEDSAYSPSREEPIVFHLHGRHEKPASMVLTEDDFLDFLVTMSQDAALLPPSIQQSLGGSSVLFLGYSLRDLNVRVLFRSLATYLERSLERTHVSVQLDPKNARADDLHAAREYLGSYFGKLRVRLFWGTCREFVAELRRRLQGSMLV